jgi:transposase-like protein
MRKRSAQELQRQSRWQEIINGQQQSGQSVRAYCRQAGVEESAFYWWRRELTRRGRQGEVPRPARRSSLPGRPGRPAARKGPLIAAEFLPVRVTADRRPEGGHGVELLLADGRVLRLWPGFDRQTLLDVLGALEGRGC